MVQINTGRSPASIRIDKHKLDYRRLAVAVDRHCVVFYVAAVKFKFKWKLRAVSIDPSEKSLVILHASAFSPFLQFASDF